MNELLDIMVMGGYGIYVWPAYSVVCFLLIMNALSVRFTNKRTIARLKKWFQRQGTA